VRQARRSPTGNPLSDPFMQSLLDPAILFFVVDVFAGKAKA
jgi:hypothetical protein